MPGLVACLALVACSHPSAVTRPGPAGLPQADAVALVPYAQRFEPIGARLAVVGDAFVSGSGTLRTGATVNDFLLVAAPFADAVATADVELRQVTWPAGVRRDIKAELATDSSLRAELLGTLDDTLLIPVWRRQVIAAATRATIARRHVAIDLGLLPPSG